MPALLAFADILEKAAELLVDPAITSDELCNRGLPGQSGAENKLLTRTRDQVVKKFGQSDDLRVDVEIFLKELSQPLPQPEHLELQRKFLASKLREQARELREFVAIREKKAKELRRLRKYRNGVSSPQILSKPKGAIFDFTTGKLTLKGKPLSLSNGERFVLTKLVEMRTATITELQTQHPRPDRVLKRLLQKYSALEKYISLPGGPGKGGYSTTIQPSQTD
jgi:hypothetical protein